MKHWLVALMMVFVGGISAGSCAQGGKVDTGTDTSAAAGSGGGTSAAGPGGAGGTSTMQGTGGGTSSSAGAGGGGGVGMNPCEGVLCDTPPPNECDGTDLKVYVDVGTCDAGACTYGSMKESCPNGCSAG